MRALIETCGPRPNRVEREVADEPDLVALLDELGQETDTTVSLGLSSTSDEVEVLLGISSDGFLLTRFRDGDFEQLVSDQQEIGDIELRLGGQPTLTPKRWLNGRVEIVRAVSHYLQTAEFPDDLLWERT